MSYLERAEKDIKEIAQQIKKNKKQFSKQNMPDENKGTDCYIKTYISIQCPYCKAKTKKDIKHFNLGELPFDCYQPLGGKLKCPYCKKDFILENVSWDEDSQKAFQGKE